MEKLQDEIQKAAEDVDLSQERFVPQGLAATATFDVDAVPEARQKVLQNERYSSDTKDRKWLAQWTVVIVSLWLGIVVLLLCFNRWLCLSDTVLVTLLGTTTLNVLGLTAIILRGHFSSKE